MPARWQTWLFSALVGSAPVIAADVAPAPAVSPVLPVLLWPDQGTDAAAKTETVAERGKDGKSNRFVSNITTPELSVYLPPPEKATGTAVVICPGGGYGGLAIDKEGHDVARWLNTQGIAGFVLKYRLPKATGDIKDIPLPLQDAQRALRMVRSRAAEWKINPERLGIMGFSAGGHLASTASTHFDSGTADAADPLARASCRPDFSILVYPVITMRPPIAHSGSRNNLLGKTPGEELITLYSNELQVSAKTPPAFLVHAKDDGVKVANSQLYADALKKAGVPHELQLFDKGGHGYGLGVNGGEVADWPARCILWLKAQKQIPQ